MILTKEVEVKITNSNINYYKKLGHKNLKIWGTITIPVSHLQKYSRIKIKVKCDVCSTEKEIKYCNYLKSFNNGNKYCCSNKCGKFKIDNLTKSERVEKRKEYCKNYTKTHKKEKKEYAKNYRKNHKKEINKYGKKYSKKYYKKNKDKIKEKKKGYGKKYYLTHKKEMKERGRQYYLTHKDKIKKNSKEYYLKNKEKRNKYMVQRRKTNIKFRILCNLRGRMWKVLKGINKSDTTKVLLGCTTEYLKTYLEGKFIQKMNWNNYGTYWEIDHIIPCSLFDLSIPEQQRKCFHYSNLQPLTGKDNREKTNKIII